MPRAPERERLHWRGVPIDERIAFHPETITIREILGDPGSERRLLRVPLPEDELLMCLCVVCPSTGRQYVLRVPPTMRSCRQAAAWIAGYDNPNDYQPPAET